jgi:hypothetical protein
MKAIRAARLRSFPLFLTAVAVIAGCFPEWDERRALTRADAEVFELVVRSQLLDTVSAPAGFLSVDTRPGADEEILARTNEPPRTLDPAQTSDSLPGRALEGIREKRAAILRSLRVEGGGPFSYPKCGGASRVNDSMDGGRQPECPRDLRRYVTVGLPHRGAAPILAMARRPESPLPDSTAELWTVLVTETNVGPGGQQWRQYAWLFKRDPEDGRLAVTERFLLSWAE